MGCICPNTNMSLQWRHDERYGVPNKQPHDCLLNHLFKAQIKENIKPYFHYTFMEGNLVIWLIKLTQIRFQRANSQMTMNEYWFG